jgi:hypothetical protein
LLLLIGGDDVIVDDDDIDVACGAVAVVVATITVADIRRNTRSIIFAVKATSCNL